MGNFPPPTNPSEVGARVLIQRRQEEQGSAPQPVPHGEHRQFAVSLFGNMIGKMRSTYEYLVKVRTATVMRRQGRTPRCRTWKKGAARRMTMSRCSIRICNGVFVLVFVYL